MCTNSTMTADSNKDPLSLGAIPVIKLMLVLLLRAGSLIVQIGTFPTDNVHNIISQNIIDVAVSITSFISIGFPLIASINNFRGLFGYGTWIGSENADIDSAINGICACLVGTHVITSLLSGRLHTKASILVYSIYSGFLLPLTMNWAWSENGWMKRSIFFGTIVGFTDYAGGILIHCAAGVSALVGSVYLGRRLLRLKDVDESSLAIGSPGLTIIGYFLIYFGLIGMALPINLDKLNSIIINSCIALSLGILTIFALSRSKKPSYWELLQCFQGGIAALVMLSSGVDEYSVVETFVITIVSSILFKITSNVIYLSPLEDYGNIIAIHVINGFIAAFLPKIRNPFHHNCWQLVCSMSIISIQLVFLNFIFYTLFSCGIIGNEDDKINHDRSQNLVKNTKTSSCNRVFKVNERSIILQPGKSRKVPKSSGNIIKENNISSVPSSISVATNTTVDMVSEAEGNEYVGGRRKEMGKGVGVNSKSGGFEEDGVVYKLQDLMVTTKSSPEENCNV